MVFVRAPGGPKQVAQCKQRKNDLGCMSADQICLPETIDEGWEAIWIVGCGPDHRRREEICDLPAEERGEPHWGGEAVYASASDQDPYLVANYETDEPPPFSSQ